jgi:hypothetical protein
MTTDGFTWRSLLMDLAKEILESVRPTEVGRGWFAALPDDHQNAILEVRETWLKTSESTGVSASQMARTICQKLTARGFKVPGYRQVQRWLTRS